MSNYPDLKKESTTDDRSYGQYIMDLWNGLSSSRFMGAKKDIMTMTKNAPADKELAYLFGYQPYVNTHMNFYRHLDPADSTVSYRAGYTTAPKDSYMHDEWMAKNMFEMDYNTLASYLADYRKKTEK